MTPDPPAWSAIVLPPFALLTAFTVSNSTLHGPAESTCAKALFGMSSSELSQQHA